MSNAYSDVNAFARMQLNSNPSINANDKIEIARVLNATSRSIDDKAGRHFYTETKVRYLNGNGQRTIDVSEDIVSLSEVAIDLDGDGTFETVLTGDGVSNLTDFYMLDPDADDPLAGAPYRMLRMRETGTLAAFPRGFRNVRLTGVFGYKATTLRLLDALGVVVTATLVATDTYSLTLSLAPAYPVGVGATLKIENEQVYVRDASSTTALVLDRGVNGTTAAIHAAAPVYLVSYPDVIVQATIMQAARLWARRNTPLWPHMMMQAPGISTEVITQGLDPDITDMLVPVRRMRGAMS